MPSGEPRVLSPDVASSEDSKSPISKGSQSRISKNSRSTPNGTSTYASPYRQTQRSVSSSAANSRTNPATQNPAHAAKFKDIVNRFNETQDEKIPLPTNPPAATRVSSAVKSRKTPPPWRPGGGSSKTPVKDTGKARQTRSVSAMGSHETKATSRASSRASTVSTTGDVKVHRPSLSRPAESILRGMHEDESMAVDGDFNVKAKEIRHTRSRSNVESERPQLTLQTERATLRHRRSRSSVEVSSSLSKQSSKSSILESNRVSKAKSPASSSSPVSPVSKIPLSQRKANSKTSTSARLPSLNSSSTNRAGTATGSSSGAKKATLSHLQVSPHSSRHVPQPSKSPTLRAYVTAPPPKKSPPLRSSRPRAQISAATTTQKQKSTRTTGGTASSTSNKTESSIPIRTPSKAKKKIPELGSIDFAARRAAVQAAFNKSLSESATREAQPKVITKESSIISLKGTIEEAEEDEEAPEKPQSRANKDIRSPIQETIEEEQENEEESQSPAEDRLWGNLQPIAAQSQDSVAEINEVSEQRMPDEINFRPGLDAPMEPLPTYNEAGEASSCSSMKAAAAYNDEKRPLTSSETVLNNEDEENIEMSGNMEMVERPMPKRFSLSGLPSLRCQIKNLPTSKNKHSGEETPLSPFTKSLLTVGEPIKPSSVPVIVTPDSPVEHRQPPPRLTDISEFLRPHSMATEMATEWTDVSGDEHGSGNEEGHGNGTHQDHQRSNHQEIRESLSENIHPAQKRLSLRAAASPIDSEPYTPTVDDGATIISFIDRYDEPREDFLSPYIDSPESTYATTIAGTEEGEDSQQGEDHEDNTEDETEEDGNYEGDEDEHSSCSSETAHSSARPSAEGSDWSNDSQQCSQAMNLARPKSPSTPRRSIEEGSPLPPTPPPKDDVYPPPVPRKNSVPFAEIPFARAPKITVPTPNRTPQQNALTLPEIATDTEPLGLAIRISSPVSLSLVTNDLESQTSSQSRGRPSLEHTHSTPSKTPFSPPSSYYSDPDGSRRSSTFTAPVTSPRASEITLPTSVNTSIRLTTTDSQTDQKNLVKRKNIMKELVDTEKAFFQDMTVTEEIYKGSANACSALTPDDIKIMFGNTDAIIQFSKAFQESLKAAVASVYVMKRSRSIINSSSVSLANSVSGDENIRGSIVSELSFLSDEEKDRQTYVGEAFGQHLAKMEKVYGDYCKNHEAAVARLQKLQNTNGVAIWLRECKAVAEDLTNAWSLESLLIKPVQRILKYPLILHTLLEVTPTDHPDYTALVWAEKEVRMVADRINELKKRKDILEKIVRKRNDSDFRHGISKLITRRAEIFRQTMGASEAVVDPMYNKLVENFNMHFVQLQVIFRDIDQYILKTNEFFDQYLEITASIKDFQDLSLTNYPEVEAKWRTFDQSMKDLVKLALSEHTHRVKKHCVEPIEMLLRMFDNPQRLMVKRNKKSVDYARYNAIKDKGTTPDKKTKELADAYLALNEALIDELPKLFSLTKKLVMVCLENFIDLQSQWNQTFSGTIITSMPDLMVPERPSDIVANFSADFSYHETLIKEFGICNGKTITTLKAMSSPNASVGNLTLSPSSVSLEEKDLPSHHRPNTADPIRDQRDRSMSFGNRSVSSLDHHRRHSGEMTVAAAMSAIATAMPTATQMVNHNARARASTSAYPMRIQTTPSSPSVIRSLSTTSPLSYRPPPTSHPRPSSAAAFAPVPETSVTHEFSRTSSPSPQVFTGPFSSALPMSDSEPSPGPSRSNSRQSSRTRRSQSRRRTMTVAQDSAPLFLAVSLYEFNIDKQMREAGFPYLTYVQGEVFDVIGIKGELWLARNQDDANGEIGWIWCKHFHRIVPE
ncbi:hypothetical protein BDZ91DRAFT_450278 [Kalaharituber pfeilii]|nr:hypothetical protein BDZ91DRAFT_450278 [Kalaharituber pfeilii]